MKTNLNAIVLFVVGVLCLAAGLVIGLSISTNQKQDQPTLQKDESVYYQLAKYKCVLVETEQAVTAGVDKRITFLVSNGYDEERAQVNVLQKMWKLPQWKEYALILQDLNDALVERDDAKDAYLYVLGQTGLGESSFNIWYDCTVSGQADPKGFIAKRLGYK